MRLTLELNAAKLRVNEIRSQDRAVRGLAADL
jgi:hypothetical protein